MCASRRCVPDGQLGAAALTASTATGGEWHRTFVALVPDAATRDAFAALPFGVRGRRVPLDQLHMTLAFLGSVGEEKGAMLAAALPSLVVPLPPLRVARLEYWPSRLRPRLAVVAFEASGELSELEMRVRTMVRQLDLPIDDHRPFRPHVTLARLPRDGKSNAPDLRCDAPLTPSGETALSRFDTLALYSSTLARHGARYRALACTYVPAG
jgi:RNA 2',3'-cyclic 3'-phosphodiesterase